MKFLIKIILSEFQKNMHLHINPDPSNSLNYSQRI